MLEVKQYEPIPEVIEAVMITAENAEEVAEWCNGQYIESVRPGDPKDVFRAVDVPTVEGFRRALVGDYVIKRGTRFYPTVAKTLEDRYQEKKTQKITCRCGKPHPPGARGVH